ncbi:MAG: hypothetical protein WC329_04330 [Candidatus Omnitrophota bacterium]|jgi:archaellum component FlaC
MKIFTTNKDVVKALRLLENRIAFLQETYLQSHNAIGNVMNSLEALLKKYSEQMEVLNQSVADLMKSAENQARVFSLFGQYNQNVARLIQSVEDQSAAISNVKKVEFARAGYICGQALECTERTKVK